MHQMFAWRGVRLRFQFVEGRISVDTSSWISPSRTYVLPVPNRNHSTFNDTMFVVFEHDVNK